MKERREKEMERIEKHLTEDMVVIPEFNDDPSFGKMIQKAWDWKELCGVDNISSILLLLVLFFALLYL